MTTREIFLFALSILPHALFADAWTQPAGHGQVILNLTSTETSFQFDAWGHVKPFSYNGQFRKVEINPYYEYGLDSKTTLVGSAFIPALKFSNSYGSQNSFGLGDIEAGIRRRVNSPESATAVSGQFTVLFPAYSSTRNPTPGNHQMDMEARLMAGRGFQFWHCHNFVSAGTAFRYRYGFPANQFRSDAAWGIDLTRHFMLMAQYSGITGLQNPKPSDLFNNPNLQPGFHLYKGQVSLVTRLTRNTSIQCGWIDAFAGRNTGNGQTVLLSLWRTF